MTMIECRYHPPTSTHMVFTLTHKQLFFSFQTHIKVVQGVIMKTEEKNSNVPKVRIAVLGQMNVGKSGRWKLNLMLKVNVKCLQDEKFAEISYRIFTLTFYTLDLVFFIKTSQYQSGSSFNLPSAPVTKRALKFQKSTIFLHATACTQNKDFPIFTSHSRIRRE